MCAGQQSAYWICIDMTTLSEVLFTAACIQFLCGFYFLMNKFVVAHIIYDYSVCSKRKWSRCMSAYMYVPLI
jgi:hypothetical protein